MSMYFNIYFDATWPLIKEKEDIRSWSIFFEQLDQLASTNKVYTVAYGTEAQWMTYWLMPKNTPAMVLWLKAFLRRRPGIYLRGVSKAWRDYFLLKKEEVHVVVASASMLTDVQKERVKEKLQDTWPKVVITWQIDSSVIGGVKCYCKDMIWDLSLRGAMHKIAMAFDIRGHSSINLQEISDAWQEHFLIEQEEVHIVVASASVLTDVQKEKVKEKLQHTWSKIIITWQIDPSVIGGLKCYCKDVVWDLSLQGAMHKIAMAFDIRGYT